MSWNYQREETHFEPLPEGKYRVRIKAVDRAQSKKGSDMLVVQLEVSGSTKILFHYIVFMPDKAEITNRMLTQFYDSFKDIPEGDQNLNNWIGKVGAVKIKHDSSYDGTPREKISYFIAADKQGDLPNWVEPDGSVIDENGFMSLPEGVVDDGMPF